MKSTIPCLLPFYSVWDIANKASASLKKKNWEKFLCFFWVWDIVKHHTHNCLLVMQLWPRYCSSMNWVGGRLISKSWDSVRFLWPQSSYSLFQHNFMLRFIIDKKKASSTNSTELPYAPPIPLLATYSKEQKIVDQTNTCLWMFIAALFIVAKMWKPPTHPQTDEYIHKMW